MAVKANRKIILLTDIKYGKSVYLDNRVPVGNWVLADFKDTKSITAALNKIVKLIQIDLTLNNNSNNE
jgi:hypothetical protein